MFLVNPTSEAIGTVMAWSNHGLIGREIGQTH